VLAPPSLLRPIRPFGTKNWERNVPNPQNRLPTLLLARSSSPISSMLAFHNFKKLQGSSMPFIPRPLGRRSPTMVQAQQADQDRW
jgi:hypothetical protein